MGKPAAEDQLVAKMFETGSDEELARAVKNLTTDEAHYFLLKLEAALKKRKLQIIGYFVAMIVWVLCMMVALAWYGTHNGFVGWVFIAPFGVVGVILYAFGRWAERVGKPPPPIASGDGPNRSDP